MKYILIIAACLSIGYYWGNNHHDAKLDAIISATEYYYQSTESFLDKLDDKYDWVDMMDDDNYYESRNELQDVLSNMKGE
jgi:lysine/ornithine N-monooxygenase